MEHRDRFGRALPAAGTRTRDCIALALSIVLTACGDKPLDENIGSPSFGGVDNLAEVLGVTVGDVAGGGVEVDAGGSDSGSDTGGGAQDGAGGGDGGGDAVLDAGDVAVDSAGKGDAIDVDGAGGCVKDADCDDGDPCTDDTCKPGAKAGEPACAHTPNTAPCNDGDACTKGDQCKAGKCASGATIACDDGNPCTDDSCEPAKGCVYAFNAATCADGDGCTGGDTCKDGACVGGTQKACGDGNPCTDDACEPLSGSCVHLPNAATCDDGDSCTSGDACIAGACAAKPACACQDDGQCNDLNACTIDYCQDGACVNEAATTGASCEDGNPCTVGDACAQSACVPGAPLVCDDSEACTSDACVQGFGCVHVPAAGACDDGNACTSEDACAGGKCHGKPSCDCKTDSVCDDQNPCTADSCVKGTCVNAPAPTGTACEDGNACTKGEVCSAGACLPGSPVVCDDANPCTDDSCDLVNGSCAFKPNAAPCDDLDPCTKADVCLAGSCTGGVSVDCDDGEACTLDVCDAQAGCTHAPFDGPCEDGDLCTTGETCLAGKCSGGQAMGCADENPCTVDGCQSDIGCTHDPMEGTCEDGDACSLGDHCVKGFCTGASLKSCDDANPCTQDACDPATGCVATKLDGVACEDGNPCTKNDSCSDGVCVAGTPPSCDDGNACTTDTCDAKTGCKYAPAVDGGVCAEAACDGLTHAAQGKCYKGSCLPGSKKACDDANPCTDDVCDAATGCGHSTVPGGSACDDGSPCTSGDVCDGLTCVGVKVSCDDANGCTVDSCDPVAGCQHAMVAEDTKCAPASCAGPVFVKESACKSGACVALAEPVTCDDGDPCTDDACLPNVGCVTTANGAPCSDADKCTTGDVCVEGACKPGATANCDDGNACTDDFCYTQKGCEHAPNAAPCDDGSVCTTQDACAGGGCVAGVDVNCDDGNTCTVDTCDPAKGCVHTALPDDVTCDDASPCTSDDHCDEGTCAGTGLTCDDGDPCTTDSCTLADGCEHEPAADGTPCGAGSCAGLDWSAAPLCVSGSCALPPAPTSCDDGNACTLDVCNAGQGCLHASASGDCDDANPCTSADVCSAGACAGAPIPCDDGNVCTTDSCDTKTGKCAATPATGTCDDGNPCTVKDACNAGGCAGLPLEATACDDANPCTDDSCSPASGCVHVPNASSCDDGDACTGGDACVSGACAGKPIDLSACDDKNVCTNDACDPKAGCVHSPNTAPCEDGNHCTSGDTCGKGVCVGGPALACSDGNTCTKDACDPKVGCQFTKLPDNTVCSKAQCDGLAYQPAASCLSGICVTPPAKICDDGLACTSDACDPLSGCASSEKPYGTTCSPASGWVYAPMCIGKLCTGFEITLHPSEPSVKKSGLTGIDRYDGGFVSTIFASGWEDYVKPSNGAMSQVVESPLGLSSKSWEKSSRIYADVRSRLTVGGNAALNGPAVATFEATGQWVTGKLDITATRPLTAVDLYYPPLLGVETYVIGGLADLAQKVQSTVRRVSYYQTTQAWSAVDTMLVTTDSSDLGCQKQVPLDIADVYSPAQSTMFFAGSVATTTGLPKIAAVAFYNGNGETSCGGVAGYKGEAYVYDPATTGDLLVDINTSGVPPIGRFRTVHGSSAKQVLVGGTHGTLFFYDGLVWTQLQPQLASDASPQLPEPWGATYDVKSVYVSNNKAWLAGEHTSTIGGASCRGLFALHGTYTATGAGWTWDKFVDFGPILSSCGADLDATVLGRAWIDPKTASVYFVGQQGVDKSGAPTAESPVEWRQLVIRLKTK